MMKKSAPKPEFQDKMVIYWSHEDKCWIAHSLKTDQVGSGCDMTTALADLLKATQQLLKLTSEDKTIAFFRNAPREIHELVSKSKPLLGENYEADFCGTVPHSGQRSGVARRS